MERNKQTNRSGFHKQGSANQTLIFRLVAICLLLYWFATILVDYIKGGPEAPSLLLLILAAVFMGGGALLAIPICIRSWKQAKAREKKEDT